MPKKKVEETQEETEAVELSKEEASEVIDADEEVSEEAEVVEEVQEKPAKKAKKPAKEAKEKEEKPKKDPHGKKYRKVAELVENNKEYTLEEAIGLLKKTATTKFDSSVEIHVNLNVDPSNADHQVKGSVVLPSGLGKEKKVAVIADGDKVKEAKEAGADFVGSQELVEKIEKGWLDFDVLVATPEMMQHVGRIGKILGTKGLMPNPKTGTVTPDVARVVKEIKKGRAVYKIDKAGIVHASVGKVSFKEEDLEKNITAFIDAIHHAKPASIKGTFVKGIHLSTTMGPGIKIEK